MRRIQILLFQLLLSGVVLGQTSQYIGSRYKAVLPDHLLPNGVRSLGGSLIGDIYANPVWDISIMSKGKDRMLWLQRSAAQSSGGVDEWEVVDVLRFPSFPRGDELLFGSGPGECTKGGKPDEDLVVHARLLRSSQTYRTIKAWRASSKTGKFIPENAVSVKCKYDAP